MPFGFGYNRELPPGPEVRAAPKELAEIAELSKEPLTSEARIEMHDSTLDDIDLWQRQAEEAGLNNLPTTPYESPGEADPYYGQLATARAAIRSLDEMPWHKRKITTELDDLKRQSGKPTSPDELKAFKEEVEADFEELPDLHSQRKLRAAGRALLRELPRTFRQSPADKDTTAGQFAVARERIHMLPELPNYQRKPAQPKSDSK